MLDLNKFSLENLVKIQKILKIALESYEFNPSNEENFFVSVEKFKKLGLDFSETISIIQKIEKEENEALKYKGFENIKKYINSDTACSTLSHAYRKEEHPLAIKDHKRIKQLYNEVLKKIKSKQGQIPIKETTNPPSNTIPKKIIKDLDKTIRQHKSQLEVVSKLISSYAQYQNKDNFSEKLTEIIEQATKPIKSTLETLNTPNLLLSTINKNYIGSTIKQLIAPYRQFENQIIDIRTKTKVFKNINFPKSDISILDEKPSIESITFAIPKDTREKREAQVALDISVIKRILLKYEVGSINFLPYKKVDNIKTAKKYILTIKDREIWINNYLLSRPHTTGTNLAFFEYISSQPKNTDITEDKMPLYLKESMSKKRIIAILGKLGFTGELLKAFFPKRGKSQITYRGNKITKNDLKKAGIKIPVFIKQLELAHTKNSLK
jgi:hypothetical protein